MDPGLQTNNEAVDACMTDTTYTPHELIGAFGLPVNVVVTEGAHIPILC